MSLYPIGKRLPAERTPEQTQTEFLFYRLLSTPSAFSQWIRPTIEGKDFRLWKKQIVEMSRENPRIKRIQGRDLGKSITAADQFINACVRWTKPTGTALFASKAEHNLEPIFRRELDGMFRRHPFLNLFYEAVNYKTFEIRMHNGVTIRGRIEGEGGSGFNTVHPDVIAWIDEVQMLSDDAVAEFYGMISADLPLIASGVPNGVRTSWGYRIDTDTAKYRFFGAKMSRLEDPRFTEEMNQELLDFYGGPDSSGYLNKVMGEWGADARMTFDLNRIVRDLPLREGAIGGVRPGFYRSFEISSEDSVNVDGTPKLDVLALRFAFRGDMPKTDKVWFTADHGQSASPTTLYIHFWDLTEKCWRTYHRILLRGMEANTQAEVVHWLAVQIKGMTGVEPVIGFDTTGHGGSAVMADLQRHGHPLVRVDVRELVDTHQTRLETDEEFRKRYAKDPFSPHEKQQVPIYQRWRQVAFPRLAREFYAVRLRLVNEPDLMKQIAGTTDYESQMKTGGGERIYETDFIKEGVPYNHDLSAFEVFGAMLHQLDTTQTPVAPKAWAHNFDIGWGVVDAA